MFLADLTITRRATWGWLVITSETRGHTLRWDL